MKQPVGKMDDFTFVSTHADKRIGSDFEDLVSAKVCINPIASNHLRRALFASIRAVQGNYDMMTVGKYSHIFIVQPHHQADFAFFKVLESLESSWCRLHGPSRPDEHVLNR